MYYSRFDHKISDLRCLEMKMEPLILLTSSFLIPIYDLFFEGIFGRRIWKFAGKQNIKQV